MTIQRVKQLYEARPFQPFEFHLADGRTILVEHPEWMLFSPSGRRVVVEERDETIHFIDLLLVTELELKGNGKRTHRKK